MTSINSFIYCRRKEIIAGMADRKLLEDKAYHIVTGLIEGVTTEQHLSDVVRINTKNLIFMIRYFDYEPWLGGYMIW